MDEFFFAGIVVKKYSLQNKNRLNSFQRIKKSYQKIMSTKKFVLKPWKTSLALDQTQAVDLWLKLRSAIERIYNQEVSQLLFEELYR